MQPPRRKLRGREHARLSPERVVFPARAVHGGRRHLPSDRSGMRAKLRLPRRRELLRGGRDLPRRTPNLRSHGGRALRKRRSLC